MRTRAYGNVSQATALGAQDRTAAARNDVAGATRRRRRILQSRILFLHLYDANFIVTKRCV